MRSRVTVGQRFGIFLSWDGRCAWCGLPLFFNQMEVDHVIPKRMSPGRLPGLLEWHGLPPDYDVWAMENLVASCRMCNAGKGMRPPPNTPAISMLLQRAQAHADFAEDHAQVFARSRGLDRHLHALLRASETDTLVLARSREIVAQILERIADIPVDGAAARLASRWVTDDRVSYGPPPFTAERRIWLVNPPGKMPVAVVLEDPSDTGTSIQNAAEIIASVVVERFPAHVTVLHYDKESDRPWGRYWRVIPVVNGVPRFGDGLAEHPHVEDSLRASGLIN